jgi:hypothetical protein
MNIEKIIEILKTGNRERSRAILKKLEQKWRKENLPKNYWLPFIKELKNFEDIKSTDNRAAFLMALRYPFIALGRKHFTICSDFIFKLLNDKSGRMRQLGVSLGSDFIFSFEIAKFVVEKKWRPNKKDAGRIRGDRRLCVSVVERLENFRNSQCGPKLAKFDYIEELPASICKDAEALMFEILDHEAPEYVYEAYKKGKLARLPLTSPDSIYEIGKMDKNLDELPMPKWMECTWRRITCGKDSCMICGRLKRDREKAIAKGLDPDSPEATIESVHTSLKETMRLLKESAKKFGINVNDQADFKISEPPRENKFPLWREVMAWNKMLFETAENAREAGAIWIETEPAADLFWYANILNSKVYRQLCNKWHIERGDDYGDFDFKYTGKILNESLQILKKSLNELSLWSTDQKGELLLAASKLSQIENKIKAI